jgi:predicted small lipoprotein YifL
MKRLLIVVTTLGLFFAISACGQRGALVMPKKPDPIVKPEAKPEQRKSPSSPDPTASPKPD